VACGCSVATPFGGTRHIAPRCEHLEQIAGIGPPLHGCSDCIDTGGTWVHLRQCLACGHTACCNESPNRHATAHFRATGHPMIRSVVPDEPWLWCYQDDRLYRPDDPQDGDDD
jgi:uncharacterized UBP type Zn finger protein